MINIKTILKRVYVFFKRAKTHLLCQKNHLFPCITQYVSFGKRDTSLDKNTETRHMRINDKCRHSDLK